MNNNNKELITTDLVGLIKEFIKTLNATNLKFIKDARLSGINYSISDDNFFDVLNQFIENRNHQQSVLMSSEDYTNLEDYQGIILAYTIKTHSEQFQSAGGKLTSFREALRTSANYTDASYQTAKNGFITIVEKYIPHKIISGVRNRENLIK